ncbi:MAG: GNAT family N-acetyltransferase [Proteobacteria bacterium]|nr:GNAT family N-acetyltransferase [Pseudomonadota bacterium]
MGNPINIRRAESKDAGLIVQLIRELAEYEKLSHEVVATEEDICAQLFNPAPVAFALIAGLNNKPVGFCVYFRNFSTFLARPGLYIEDLYVRPEVRGQGVGKKLLQELVRIAKENNYGRVTWSALNWNTPAINFYKSLGAKPMKEWLSFRLAEAGFDKVLKN